MTTTTKKTVTVNMSDRAPIKVDAEAWPKIACADWYSGAIECQANEVAYIRVREHRDGRRIVYGDRDRGPGGQYAGYRGAHAGYLVEAVPAEGMRQPDDGGPVVSTQPDDTGTVRAIRRVAGVIDKTDLADECIADLPAQEFS